MPQYGRSKLRPYEHFGHLLAFFSGYEPSPCVLFLLTHLCGQCAKRVEPKRRKRFSTKSIYSAYLRA